MNDFKVGDKVKYQGHECEIVFILNREYVLNDNVDGLFVTTFDCIEPMKPIPRLFDDEDKAEFISKYGSLIFKSKNGGDCCGTYMMTGVGFSGCKECYSCKDTNSGWVGKVDFDTIGLYKFIPEPSVFKGKMYVKHANQVNKDGLLYSEINGHVNRECGESEEDNIALLKIMDKIRGKNISFEITILD